MDRVVVEPTGDEVERRGTFDVVVWDGASLAGPRDVLDGGWLALRPEARAMIDADAGGKLLLIAPPPSDAGAEAARAGIENLARTLSVEWSRHGIRTAALLPGAATAPEDVAELVAFLASRAGDYYSGLPLRPGVGVVASAIAFTLLDSIEALPGCSPAALAAGAPRAGDRRVWHERLRRERRRRRCRRAAHGGRLGARGAVLRRARLGDVHARRRGGPRARGHVRLPSPIPRSAATPWPTRPGRR